MNRILVLMQSKENRKLLSEYLSKHYEIVFPENGSDSNNGKAIMREFDLCIIDALSFLKHQAFLQKIRQLNEPVFVPVLLTTSRADAGLSTGGLWKTVDELITTPVEKLELHARIEALLRTRKLSKELANATATREEFLNIVSHDLKGPLSVILMRASLILRALRESDIMAGVSEHVAGITDQAQRMRRMIDDLLDAGKIENHHLILDKQNWKVRDVVSGALEFAKATAGEKQVSLRTEVNCEECYVRCDRDRMVQALSNVLGNAIKFVPVGGEVVFIVRSSGARIEFTVEDNGPGISRELVPHLFEKYTTSAKGREGSGLGLYIVKGIVNAHGGEVSAHSRPGKGTRIAFSLPVGEGAGESNTAAA